MSETQTFEQVTELLRDRERDDPAAREKLLGLLYEPLHALARVRMAGERADHTLQPTILVHEVWLKLCEQAGADWKDRGHFLAIAGQAMRRVLVNHARDRAALKRGGGERVDALEVTIGVDADGNQVEILALEEALEELGRRSPEQARVVEMRFFAGMTTEEIAAGTGLSPRTVDRRWLMARSWLHERLVARSDLEG